MTTTGCDTDCMTEQRQTKWFAIMAFSIIAIASTATNFATDKISDETKEVKWVVSLISIAFSFATLSVLATVFTKDKFNNTSIETGMSFLTAVCWTGAIPIIMNPDNDLAVGSYLGGITNLNLYFASWAAFILSIINFFACLSISMNTLMNIQMSDSEPRCSRSSWVAFMVTSFVVMLASVRIYQDIDCDKSLGLIDNFEAVCDRTNTGISMGSISTIIAAVWLMISLFWMKGPMGSKVEFGVIVLLLIIWTFGVVILTFDEDKSPAVTLGNLYFFTWGSWSLIVIMSMTSLQHLMKKTPPTDTNTNADTGMMNEDMKDKPPMEQGSGTGNDGEDVEA